MTVDTAQMADELCDREGALRRLPLPYSLALRLRDAGVDAELICQYIDLEFVAWDGFYRIAEAKFAAAQRIPMVCEISSHGRGNRDMPFKAQ